MLKDSPRRIGEVLEIGIEHDPAERTVEPPPAFTQALQNNTVASQNFEKLPPSLQKELVRYLANLKTTEAFQKNLAKIIAFLEGTGDFFGRKLG